MSDIDNTLTEEEAAILRGDLLEEYPEDIPDEDPEDIPDEDPRLIKLFEQVEASRERNAWLEEQLSKLISKESAVTVTPEVPKVTYDFEAKEEEYASLLIDGEVAKAAKLRSQIDSARTSELLSLIRGETDLSSKKAVVEANNLIENEKFSRVVETIEASHPFFNPEHKLYNEEAVETANSLMNGFIAKGDTRVNALKKAVARILPLYTTEDRPSGLGADRKATAGKVAADASNRQPPKTSGVKGGVSPKVKPLSEYSDKEFSALTAAELRELRGDM